MKRIITYLCVILNVKHKKWPILPVFTEFLILMAAKIANIIGDVTSFQHRHHR